MASETPDDNESMNLKVEECYSKSGVKRSPPNPYRWVILMASSLTMFTTGSMTCAAGVIHVALVEAYPDMPTSYIVWIGSVYMFVFGPIGPVGSAVISTFSCRTCVVTSGILAFLGYSSNFLVSDPRWLIFTYGVLGGCSVGLAVIGSLVIITYYFTDHIALASGVVMCGQGLGIFVHSPLVQYFVDTYGIRGAFLLTGGFAAHACIFGLLMRPGEFEMTRQRQRKLTGGGNRLRETVWALRTSCSSYVTLFKKGSFLYLMAACLTIGMAFAIEYLYIPDYFHKGGVSKQVSSFVISVSGIGSIISRLLAGVLAVDKRFGNGMTFSCLNGITGSLTFFIHVFRGSSEKALAYGFLYGLYSGGTMSVLTAMTMDSVGVELSANGFGLMILTNGIGYLVGPPLSTMMFMTTCVLGFLSTSSQKRAEEVTMEVSTSDRPQHEDTQEQVTDSLMNTHSL